MYLHIVPALLHRMANECFLKSITIPELDFNLTSESLSTKRPYPNKTIWVGMLKGRKALEGILLKTDKKLDWFTTEYQWEIEGLDSIRHTVTTYIEDHDYDLVSHNILLGDGYKNWESRRHQAYKGIAPVHIQPMMKSLYTPDEKRESHDTWTTYEWGDFLNMREESLLLHSIESERLSSHYSDRLPTLDSAIKC